MLRHFATSLEGIRDVSTGPVLSLEEEALVMDEAADTGAQIDGDLNEVERVIEVASGLEDLAVVADTIEEATPQQLALVQVAGDLAVAGTDVTSDDLLPSLESYKGGKISMEGLREIAQTVWQNIIQFLAKIWAQIEQFYHLLFSTIASTRARLNALKERNKAAVSKKSEVKGIIVNVGVAAICVDYKPVTKESELLAALKNWDTAAEYTFNKHLDGVIAVADVVVKSLANFDPSKAVETATQAKDDIAKVFSQQGKPPGVKGLDGKRFPGFTTSTGQALLGNVSLLVKAFNSQEGASVLGSLERFRQSGTELGATKAEGDKLPAEVTFETLSNGAIDKVIAECEAILKTAESYKTGSRSAQVKKTREALKAAGEKATAAMKKFPTEQNIDSITAHYKALVNFNKSFVSWVKNPAGDMLRSSLTTVRAAMMLCSKSLDTYK